MVCSLTIDKPKFEDAWDRMREIQTEVAADADRVDRHDDAHRSARLRRRREVAGQRGRFLRAGRCGERGGEQQGKDTFHGRRA